MVNAVLLSVIVNELIAPPLVRYALIRAGETHNEKSREADGGLDEDQGNR